MAFLTREKLFSARWFRTYLLIMTGSFILASGFVFFITPHKIVPGGVYGISIVIHYVTEGLFSFAPKGFPIGLMGLILNVPLTIMGIRILGPRFGVKTITGFILTSAFIDLITLWWGNRPLAEGDPLLSSIFGGVLIGLGLGLIFRSKATSGGSDIIAMVISKYTRAPVGQTLILVDSIIVLIGLIVFKDWKIPLYSWLVIYISGRVIDTTLQGIHYDKALFIVSDYYETIRDKLIRDLDRGGTLINAQGMWEGKERKIIFTNVNRRELAILQEFIREVDQKAFMTVIDASEVIGLGFKPLEEK